MNAASEYEMECNLSAASVRKQAGYSFVGDQGGHKAGKPKILGEFFEPGKLREFCVTLGKIVTTKCCH